MAWYIGYIRQGDIFLRHGISAGNSWSIWAKYKRGVVNSNEGDFWDRRYREEGTIWGEGPSPTAVLAASFLPPAMHVMDVGFGYRRDLVYLARRGCQVSGVELSHEGHHHAERWLNAIGLSAERLCLGRFEETDLPAEGFDGVLSHRMAHLLISQATVTGFARKVCQIVRPGGLLALGARSPLDLNLDEMTQVEPGVWEYRRRPGHRIRYWDRATFDFALADAFELVVVEQSTEPETVAQPVPCHLSLLVARRKTKIVSSNLFPTS